MILVAFYLGLHDSNVAASVDGVVRYAKSERVTGIKHHQADLAFVARTCAAWGISRPDAIAFSDGDRNGLGGCALGEMAREVAPLAPWPETPTFCIDHHYGHVLSTWPVADTAEADIGIVIDGRGDHELRTSVIARPGSSSPRLLHGVRHRSFGRLLSRIGELMELRRTPGNEDDLAGKVMGAQAYGEVDLDYVGSLDIEDLGSRWFDLITEVEWQGAPPAAVPGFFRFDNPIFRDWLASVHRVLEQHTEDLFRRFAEPGQAVLFAGGCAQNVVCNERLARLFPRLAIPPHCYDGGISLGCLELLRLHHGLPPFSRDGFPYWQDDHEEERPSSTTIRQVAELLAAGKAVGWFQGRGEVGPRALGHRSILMDPRRADAQDYINERIKFREPWRPYAPSVLAGAAGDWFDLDGPSPFMLRSVPVRPERRELIPAVVHVDGTSRVHTADGGAGPLEELLVEFERLTSVPLLLNTSLNASGSPIFSSEVQCLRLFASTSLDALVMGDRLVVR